MLSSSEVFIFCPFFFNRLGGGGGGGGGQRVYMYIIKIFTLTVPGPTDPLKHLGSSFTFIDKMGWRCSGV